MFLCCATGLGLKCHVRLGRAVEPNSDSFLDRGSSDALYSPGTLSHFDVSNTPVTSIHGLKESNFARRVFMHP